MASFKDRVYRSLSISLPLQFVKERRQANVSQLSNKVFELWRFTLTMYIGMFGHVHSRPEGVALMIVTDAEYPSRVAFTLLTKIGDDFIAQIPKTQWRKDVGFLPLQNYLTQYQDPHKADPMMRVQKELDETKIVMHKTIESVLERGEKLDNLVNRSEQLSAQSKVFYKSAKKTNSCCGVM